LRGVAIGFFVKTRLILWIQGPNNRKETYYIATDINGSLCCLKVVIDPFGKSESVDYYSVSKSDYYSASKLQPWGRSAAAFAGCLCNRARYFARKRHVRRLLNRNAVSIIQLEATRPLLDTCDATTGK
jgi:hypothetical protein